jgi:hypothetical protein
MLQAGRTRVQISTRSVKNLKVSTRSSRYTVLGFTEPLTEISNESIKCCRKAERGWNVRLNTSPLLRSLTTHNLIGIHGMLWV